MSSDIKPIHPWIAIIIAAGLPPLRSSHETLDELCVTLENAVFVAYFRFAEMIASLLVPALLLPGVRGFKSWSLSIRLRQHVVRKRRVY